MDIKFEEVPIPEGLKALSTGPFSGCSLARGVDLDTGNVIYVLRHRETVRMAVTPLNLDQWGK